MDVHLISVCDYKNKVCNTYYMYGIGIKNHEMFRFFFIDLFKYKQTYTNPISEIG